MRPKEVTDSIVLQESCNTLLLKVQGVQGSTLHFTCKGYILSHQYIQLITFVQINRCNRLQLKSKHTYLRDVYLTHEKIYIREMKGFVT